jgi:hypothetical protein
VKRDIALYANYKNPIICQFNKYVKIKRKLAKYPNIKWATAKILAFIDPNPHVQYVPHNLQITVQLLESECMPVLIWVSNITSIWISSQEMLETFNSRYWHFPFGPPQLRLNYNINYYFILWISISIENKHTTQMTRLIFSRQILSVQITIN